MEGGPAIGDLDFRHMATCAVAFLNWTYFAALVAVSYSCTLQRVTRQALSVISGRIGD